MAILVLPLFAFANAGVSLEDISLSARAEPLPLGIALGLFIGKQAGVLGFSWLGARAGFCRLPDGATWLQVYGIACLAGVGFTMSLFIGTLAFDTAGQLDQIRLRVLLGSGRSALFGLAVLKHALRQMSGASGAAKDHARS